MRRPSRQARPINHDPRTGRARPQTHAAQELSSAVTPRNPGALPMPHPTIIASPLSGLFTKGGITVDVAIGALPTMTMSHPSRLTHCRRCLNSLGRPDGIQKLPIRHGHMKVTRTGCRPMPEKLAFQVAPGWAGIAFVRVPVATSSPLRSVSHSG